MPQLVGFIGPSYTLQSTEIECQRSINLYPEVDESGVGKNVAALIGTPGLKPFVNLAVTIRGMIFTSQGRLFALAGITFYEIFSDGGAHYINRGTVLTQSGKVGIADNGFQLFITDGPYAYAYDLTANTLTNISNVAGAGTCTFQDSYFIFNVPGTQQFFISGTDAPTVDPLDFASKEGAPDNIQCVLSVNRNLWLFGAKTTEVWYNSGAELFPFARIDGAFIEHGAASPWCAAALDNTVYWLSQEQSGAGIVYMATGLQPTRVSTFAVEQAIQRYPTITDATAYTYQQDGHPFYVLNFPSGNATWVYDANAQLWHERAWTDSNGSLNRHRADTCVAAFGKIYVGDWQNGNVYQLDVLTYSDNGAPISRIRVSPYVSNELKRLFISQLTISMDTGLQLDGNNRIPECMLQWSDDGGGSWSNEVWTSLGPIGANRARVTFRRLGHTRRRVFRFKITDAVPVAIIDALIEVKAGNS